MNLFLYIALLAVPLASVGAHEGSGLSDFFQFMRLVSKPQVLDRAKDAQTRMVESNLVHAMSQTDAIEKPVLGFSWNNCGGASDIAKVKSISVSPDPINLKGTIYLSAEIDVTQDIGNGTDISVTLAVQKKIFFWIDIPCVDNFGSCTYNNLCQRDPYRKKACPANFIKFKVPCKCPFGKGNYNVKDMPLKLTLPSSVPSWLSDGDYKVNAVLKMGQKEITCVDIQLSLSN